MDTSLLHNLRYEEKLRIVLELWDDLAASNAPIDVSEAAIAEANRRLREMLDSPEIAIDDKEMWRRIDGWTSSFPSGLPKGSGSRNRAVRKDLAELGASASR